MKLLEKKILHALAPTPHIVAIALFGSHAKNMATSQSDVDIAVLFEQPHIPDTNKIIQLREEISAVLGHPVDLICLNTASPILGMQVYLNGKWLKINNSKTFSQYQMLLFSDYAELKELRLPMEQNILKRKYYDRP
ncbi:MAG: nucleotidyltransferase domain-containing protein [Chlamydiia bacterium]|nr:nucleotidyltransferase domain-containing protein [Chlamydiia bacterium]